MTDTPTVPPETLQVTKLITIIEEGGQEVRAEIIREHFEQYDEATMKHLVTNLLGTASERIRHEATRLEETPQEGNQNTPVNPGSLYDDIVFEAGIYASNDGQVLVNTSFGRLADPSVPLTESVKHVADVMDFIAAQFAEADFEEAS